jgi:replicative DNA helicase
VFLIHRPRAERRADPTLGGEAEFIVAQQRNGPTADIDMVFPHEFQPFERSDCNEESAE